VRPTANQKFFIVGGAGFIGSHFTDHLLGAGGAAAVTLYDNFTSGREWHHAHHAGDARLRVVRGNVEDTEALVRAMEGHDVVIHLASNPDIARAAREPTIDFFQGTALTASVVEAMRRTSARRILYASGSGVYGDLGTVEAAEDLGPMLPVSTYGASKLAGENLIGSYAYMFGLSGCAFRFGNVVGPRQTHGVGFDFARRLLDARAKNESSDAPIVLKILGDGKQSKSYVHITDIVRAVHSAGHLIGNHTDTHPVLLFQTPQRVLAELTACSAALEDVLGQPVRYFRPPHGARRSDVLHSARALGMAPVMWNAMGYDWEPDTIPAKIEASLESGVRRNRRRGHGSNLLLHDGGQAGIGQDRSATVEAVARLVPKILGEGGRFVTVDEWNV